MNSDDRQFFIALKNILVAIKQTGEALVEAINNHAKSNIEARNLPRTATVIQDPDQEAAHATQFNRSHTLQVRNFWVQAALCIFTAMAFFAAAYYAYVARKQMHLDERAWIVIEYPSIPLSVGSRISVPLTMKNTGKTPARKLNGVLSVSVLDVDDTPKFDYVRGYYAWSTGYLPQNVTDTRPWIALDKKTHADLVLSDDMYNALQSGHQLVTVHGRIDYYDIFDVPHRIIFCQQGGGPQNGMKPGGSKECSAYNNIDNNQ